MSVLLNSGINEGRTILTQVIPASLSTDFSPVSTYIPNSHCFRTVNKSPLTFSPTLVQNFRFYFGTILDNIYTKLWSFTICLNIPQLE